MNKKSSKTKSKKNKPLNPDITGIYLYNENKKAYYNTKKTTDSKYKKVFHIRIGYFKPVLWVNHTDYSNIECDYNIENDCYKFIYNGLEYSIPVNPSFADGLGYYVKIFRY